MTIGDGPAIPQELAEEAPAVAAAATATGEADPNAGSGDSSDYDVASARTLLREARREIDNVAIRNSPRSWKGGGIGGHSRHAHVEGQWGVAWGE